MATDRTLGLGIVGAHPAQGWALTTHLPALRDMTDYRIAAVCHRAADTAAAAAKVFNAPRWCTDARQLAQDPAVDIVVVCVRVPFHFAVVAAALDAGKHVYCEWPLGRGLDESLRLNELARRAGVHTAIGLQGRTSPVIESARSLVAAGKIGRLLSARLYSTSAAWGSVTIPAYAYLTDQSTGATLLTITGGHSLDSLCRVAGAFDSVSALLVTQHREVKVIGSEEVLRPTAPDHAMIIGRHGSGCVTSAHIVGGRPETGRFLLEFIGTDGYLRITAAEPGDYQVTPLTLSGTLRGELMTPWSDREQSPGPGGAAANVARVYRQLADAIRTNTRSVADFADAVDNARLIEAIERSSANQRTVQLTSIPTC